MKRLYLVRHAKSSWDDPDLDDAERPLNDRGRKDAPLMGKRLKERELAPGLIISSPAIRAWTTCQVIVEILGYDPDQIHAYPEVYHASSETLLKIVQGLADKYDSVLLVGHNPGLTDFVNDLTEGFIPNIPTAGVVGIQFKVDHWKEVRQGAGHLEFFDFPKRNKRK